MTAVWVPILLAGIASGGTLLGTGDITASQVDTGSSTLAAGSGSEEAGTLEGQELPSSCVDLEEGCIEWAAEDGCIHHGPSFMFERCRRSCGVCGQPSLTDVPLTVCRLSLLHLCCSSILFRTCTDRRNWQTLSTIASNRQQWHTMPAILYGYT